jgi:hypothetical protein
VVYVPARNFLCVILYMIRMHSLQEIYMPLAVANKRDSLIRLTLCTTETNKQMCITNCITAATDKELTLSPSLSSCSPTYGRTGETRTIVRYHRKMGLVILYRYSGTLMMIKPDVQWSLTLTGNVVIRREFRHHLSQFSCGNPGITARREQTSRPINRDSLGLR